MNVAVDARALLSERTGIGVYTEQIARGLAALPDVDVTLFAPRPLPAPVAGVASRADCNTYGTLWLQTRLARRLAEARADVLLAAVTIVPARLDIPAVPVVHDLTPISHPEWHRRKTNAAFLPWIERTLARAPRVIAVSRTTAREIAERFPDVGGRVTVIPHGVDPRYGPSGLPGERERVRQRYAGGRPYVLSLATLEPRKNLAGLIAACERLWREGARYPDLLLAGGPGWKSESLHTRIGRSPFRDRIHLAGYVPEDDAPALFRSAEAFGYPSFAEGFGLPVLEAMASGVPAVVSTAPALVELAGGAAAAAPADDPDAIAAALASVLDDGPVRRSAIDGGLARAARFRWDAAAEATAEVLRDACARAAA